MRSTAPDWQEAVATFREQSGGEDYAIEGELEWRC